MGFNCIGHRGFCVVFSWDLDGGGTMKKQTKITDKQAMYASQAARLVGQCLAWDDTPEGRGYWDEVQGKLLAIGTHGTTDGKPYVQPALPIPDGYRLAVAGDEGRRDCKLWDETNKVWRRRGEYYNSCAFDDKNCYIVLVDIAPTDEEASQLPHVMVRDYEDRPWERKVLVRIASTGMFCCLALNRRNLETWTFCRHLYLGE